MFRGGRAKKKKGNFVRALRTSIGWIIPSQNTKVERKDEKKLEQQKDDSRKAYAEELKRKIKRSRGLGNRLSSIFSGRKASTIHPADILSIQRKKESKLAGHGNGSEAPLERRAGGGNGRIQLQEVKSPSRRMSASRLLGLGQEYIYKDFMPYYIERYNRWETFDSLLKRANKWIKENQLQVLTLETMIIPAGNMPEHENPDADKFVTVEVLRIWYDKNQTLQQSLRESKRELPKTLFSSFYYSRMSKKSCIIC